MNDVSYEDRLELQKHLSALWSILNKCCGNDFNLSEFLIRYKPSKPEVVNNSDFSICISNHETCWIQVNFELTEEEKLQEKEHLEQAKRAAETAAEEMRAKREKEEEQERDEMAEYWSKACAERPDLYGDFEWMMFRWNWPKQVRDKYVEKYGIVRKYDDNGELLSCKAEYVDDASSTKRDDPCKLAEDYLNSMFKDSSWKDAAIVDGVEIPESVDIYLDSVRNFIEMQEKYYMHGDALYTFNEARAVEHEKMLEHFGLNGSDMNSEVARYITKNIDFVGKYNAKTNRTRFYSDYESGLRLSYALHVVKNQSYIR